MPVNGVAFSNGCIVGTYTGSLLLLLALYVKFTFQGGLFVFVNGNFYLFGMVSGFADSHSMLACNYILENVGAGAGFFAVYSYRCACWKVFHVNFTVYWCKCRNGQNAVVVLRQLNCFCSSSVAGFTHFHTV